MSSTAEQTRPHVEALQRPTEYQSVVSSVPFPAEINLFGDDARTHAVGWIQRIIHEAREIYPDYKGAFLCGSIAHGTSDNGSDVDLLHVVRRKDEQKVTPVRERIASLLGLYGIRLDDKWISLTDILEADDERLGSIKAKLMQLDRDTIPILQDEILAGELEYVLQFRERMPVIREKSAVVVAPKKLDVDKLRALEQAI